MTSFFTENALLIDYFVVQNSLMDQNNLLENLVKFKITLARTTILTGHNLKKKL